ncbi:MAG: protein kinase domain-containing protein [Blastocatellia bacterium]
MSENLSPESMDALEAMLETARAMAPEARAAYLATYLNDTSAPDYNLRRRAAALLPGLDQFSAALAQAQPLEQLLPAPLFVPGEDVAGYKIIELLGRGGMGEVWLAYDADLPNQRVAIKVMSDQIAGDPRFQQRFQEEARVAAELTHDNLCRIHTRIYHKGRPCLVFDYIPGQSLADVMASGSLPPEKARAWFTQILRAIAAMHARGIIHCDLKPGNIRITEYDTVKVLDFGLARLLPLAAPAPAGAPTQADTSMGGDLYAGTLSYMAPEQCLRQEPGRPADFWALGCMLYEAMTTRHPFRRDTTQETIAEILKGTPAWDALRDCPAGIRELIHQCLEKDPEKRLSDTGAAIRMLEQAEPTPALEPTRPAVYHAPAPKPKPWYQEFGAGLALLTMIFSIALPVWLNRERAAPVSRPARMIVQRDESGDCNKSHTESVAERMIARLERESGIATTPANGALVILPRLRELMQDASVLQAALVPTPGSERGKNAWFLRLATPCGETSNLSWTLLDAHGQTVLPPGRDTEDQILRLVAGRAAPNQTAAPQTPADNRRIMARAALNKFYNADALREATTTFRQLIIENNSPAAAAPDRAALADGLMLLSQLPGSGAPEMAREAMSLCEMARADAGHDRNVQLRCGRVYLMHGDYPMAAISLDAAYQQDKSDVYLTLSLALAHERAGDRAAAAQYYTAAEQLDPADWLVRHECGAFRLYEGKFQAATDQLAAAATHHSAPHYTGITHGLSLAYLERYGEAQARFAQALRNVTIPAHKATALFDSGLAYVFAGDCAKARDAFTAARQHGNDALTEGALGDVCQCLQQTAPARRHRNEAIRLAAIEDGLTRFPGSVAEWHARLGHREQAIRIINDAAPKLRDNPDFIISAIRVFQITEKASELDQWLALASRNGKVMFELRHDPLLDGLRRMPAYQKYN